MPTVGQVVRQYRIEAQLSQGALAQRVGVQQPRISAIERNDRPPSLAQLHKIEDALGLNRGAILKAAGQVNVRATRPPIGELVEPREADVDLEAVTMGLQAAVNELSKVAKALGFKLIPDDRRETEG